MIRDVYFNEIHEAGEVTLGLEGNNARAARRDRWLSYNEVRDTQDQLAIQGVSGV